MSHENQNKQLQTSSIALDQHRLFTQSLHEKLKQLTINAFVSNIQFPLLLKAIIDNDSATVVKLLDKNPELLLIDPSHAGTINIDSPGNFVIQSKHTHVKFLPKMR